MCNFNKELLMCFINWYCLLVIVEVFSNLIKLLMFEIGVCSLWFMVVIKWFFVKLVCCVNWFVFVRFVCWCFSKLMLNRMLF